MFVFKSDTKDVVQQEPSTDNDRMHETPLLMYQRQLQHKTDTLTEFQVIIQQIFDIASNILIEQLSQTRTASNEWIGVIVQLII